MLPQVIGPDIGQLHRIQGAPAQMGRRGCMGCHTLEVVGHLHIGKAAAGHNGIEIRGVPGHSGIQLVKDALPGHECLARTALFTGGAEVDHRTAVSGVLQVLLDAYGGGNGTHTEHIVSAAVTGGAGTERLPDCAARLLAQAGQGVELAQDTDHRLAAAIAGGESGFNASYPTGDGKALLFQLPAECLCRLMLGKGQFRIVPDGVAQRRKLGRFGIDHLIHCFFIHDTGSFHRFSPAPYPGQELY